MGYISVVPQGRVFDKNPLSMKYMCFNSVFYADSENDIGFDIKTIFDSQRVETENRTVFSLVIARFLMP